jgi:hypothetical protein
LEDVAALEMGVVIVTCELGGRWICDTQEIKCMLLLIPL